MSVTNGPGQSHVLLIAVSKHVHSLRIPSLVIGAIAAAYYGAVRASRDADLLIAVPSDAVRQKLESALVAAGWKCEFRPPDRDDPVRGMIIVEDAFENRVDLILGLYGMSHTASERGITAPFAGGEIRIVGLEDFIAMKLFAAGPQDLQDARDALHVSRDRLNSPLLHDLARGFGAATESQLQALLHTK